MGKYDSLIKNPDIPLWFRDGNSLFQKYFRQRHDSEGLFYYSTQIFSAWDDDRASEYVELEAVIVMKRTMSYIVKILDVEVIEDMCVTENYKELGLMPYTCYEMQQAEEYKDPGSFTISFGSPSMSNDDTFDDVTEEGKDEETSN